jgi:hypothetical protein
LPAQAAKGAAEKRQNTAASGSHRALDLRPPDRPHTPSFVEADSNALDLRIRRRDLLGGLIHEYEIAAAA